MTLAVGLCAVEEPIIIELAALRPFADRPPTADFERDGGVPLDTVPLLEALLLSGGDDGRSSDCNASL